MTEQELKEKINEAAQDINPLIKVLVNALCDAHKKGFLVGFKLGMSINASSHESKLTDKPHPQDQ